MLILKDTIFNFVAGGSFFVTLFFSPIDGTGERFFLLPLLSSLESGDSWVISRVTRPDPRVGSSCITANWVRTEMVAQFWD